MQWEKYLTRITRSERLLCSDKNNKSTGDGSPRQGQFSPVGTVLPPVKSSRKDKSILRKAKHTPKDRCFQWEEDVWNITRITELMLNQNPSYL